MHTSTELLTVSYALPMKYGTDYRAVREQLFRCDILIRVIGKRIIRDSTSLKLFKS